MPSGSSSSNPVEAHRRAERKKELKKNKAKRLKERDARVASERSVASVSAEIATLETKRQYQNDHLDNTDTRALERLRKELRICQAAEAERRARAEEERLQALEDEAVRQKQYARSEEAVRDANEAKFGKYAKMSVYYDEVMNPYGAAPPGKPMVYHARGGGTTMDARRACLPPDLHAIRAETGEANAKIKSEEKTEGAEEGAEKKRRKRQWDDSGAGNTGTGTDTGTDIGTSTTAGSFAPPPNTESITLSCPQQMVGRIIGRLGTTIKDIQAKSRCRVEVRQQQSSRQSRCSGAGAGAGDNDGQRQPQSKPGEALVTIGGERVTSQGKWRRMLSFKLEIRVRVRRNLRVRVRVVVKTEPSSNGRRQPAARLPLRAMPLQLVLPLAVALAVVLAVRFSQSQSYFNQRDKPHIWTNRKAE